MQQTHYAMHSISLRNVFYFIYDGAIGVGGSGGHGGGRRAWRECVTDSMGRLEMTGEAARDRAVWRDTSFGNRLTRASADNVSKNSRKR